MRIKHLHHGQPQWSEPFFSIRKFHCILNSDRVDSQIFITDYHSHLFSQNLSNVVLPLLEITLVHLCWRFAWLEGWHHVSECERYYHPFPVQFQLLVVGLEGVNVPAAHSGLSHLETEDNHGDFSFFDNFSNRFKVIFLQLMVITAIP